jgi:hypothetical protein
MSEADDRILSRSAELERVAMLYIDGLMTADGGEVPLHKDVTRAHLIVVPYAPLSWQRARGAELIRADFSRERLTVKKNMRITVDPHRSSVVILWESAMDDDFARAITIVDRFVIKEGLITEIEIISIPQSRPFVENEYAGWTK